jgi:serine/threonine protein kinase
MSTRRFKRIADLLSAALEQRTALEDDASPVDERLEAELEAALPSEGDASRSQGAEAESTSVAEPDRHAGEVLKERYRLDRVLGRGGFGIVYLAHDLELHEKPVVIKMLRDHVDRAWFLRKFDEECKALARIDHPGVVGILDQGETPDRRRFLVMEYVPGPTLQSAIADDGGMDLARVGRLIGQIGEALGAAHDHGICHRDLKPANIILRDLGRGQEMPVIIDFGVATVTEVLRSDSVTTRIAGSYPYMAPEQHLGHPELASDTYSLGVIAYEAVTGRRPFDEESAAAVFASQRQGIKIKPRTLRHDLPQDAEAAVLKALAYDPKDRYAHPTEFGAELAGALNAVTARPDSLRRRRWMNRFRMAGIAMVLFALVGILIRLRPDLPAATSSRSPLSERTMSYSVLVQKYRNGRAFQQPLLLSREMLFPPDYGIRLMFNFSQIGYLYLLSEDPSSSKNTPVYNVLFPAPFYNGGSALLQPNQEVQVPPDEKRFFRFDQQVGLEKVWVIWARTSAPELEAVKPWVNFQDRGRIKNAVQTLAIERFLAKEAEPPPRVERDATRTTVHRSGDVLVTLLTFEHY